MIDNSVHITVPLVPPSVNHYVKHTRTGRHYVTKEAIAFKEAIALFARGRYVASTSYRLHATVFLGKGQRLDFDNGWKVIADGLKDAGVIKSDAWVKKATIEIERDWANPRTEILAEGL